jgi:hypothetical protein
LRWAKAHNGLRSLLREFFPTFLATFTGRFALRIASAESKRVLAIAPTPGTAARLSASRIAAALGRTGRSRNIAETADEIKAGLRKSQLRQSLLVETAMGNHALALLAALYTACRNVDELGQASAELFQTHPDYAIIASFPGLVASTGTRVLTEIGDDRIRFADARALKACVGSAPASLQLSPSRPLATCFGSDTDVRHSHVLLDFVRHSQVFLDGNAGSRPELVES